MEAQLWLGPAEPADPIRLAGPVGAAGPVGPVGPVPGPGCWREKPPNGRGTIGLYHDTLFQ